MKPETKQTYLGLDIGERRIGVAVGDSIGRIAVPLVTLVNDSAVDVQLINVVTECDATHLVVGRPRSQDGNTSGQTTSVEQFSADHLNKLGLPILWQDESVTSVMAEERLKARKKPYTKQDIDAEAASIILQDYLDTIV